MQSAWKFCLNFSLANLLFVTIPGTVLEVRLMTEVYEPLMRHWKDFITVQTNLGTVKI